MRALFSLGVALAFAASGVSGRFFGSYNPATNQNGWANSGLWTSVGDVVAARTMPGSTFTQNFLDLQAFGFVTGSYGLAPNSQQLFAQYGPLFQSLQGNGTIIGLQLGDELRCHGMSQDDLHTYAQQAKAACPACQLWLNECHGTVMNKFGHFGVPPELTYFSIDYYSFADHQCAQNVKCDWVGQTLKPFYNQYVIPLLRSGQSYFIVPSCSGWSAHHAPSCGVHCHYAQSRHQAPHVADWCQNDGQCAGIMFWYWQPIPTSPSCPQCNWACAANPDSAQTFQAIGQQIMLGKRDHKDNRVFNHSRSV